MLGIFPVETGTGSTRIAVRRFTTCRATWFVG